MPELSAAPSSYDTVTYPGRAHPQTQPDRLATLATLFGLSPAPVETCRVLELGCGDGTNLLPVARGAPGSRCVGIDLAAGAVAKGAATAQALGLSNLSLRQMDVMDVSGELGEFDYVIAHGLYSWVPGPVREKVLEICRAKLSPNGVACVSYNAYPGCHIRQMVREMIRYHVARFSDAREQVEQAKGFLKFLADARAENDAWGRVLRWELERVARRDPGALYHDDLAEVNDPFYFHEFNASAAGHGLQYLAEADFAETQYASPDPLPPGGTAGAKDPAKPMRTIVAGLPPDAVVAREQYADFLRGRMFRQTLLCHAGLRVARPAAAARVATLYAAAQIRPASPEPDVRSIAAEQFIGTNGSSISTNQPLVKAALLELAVQWPRPVRFDELLGRAREASGAGGAAGPAAKGDEQQMTLCGLLLNGFGGGMIQLHSYVPPLVTEPTERPVASALARIEASQGTIVTNVFSARILMQDAMSRALLSFLDGSRDRDALARDLAGAVARGEAAIEQGGRRVTDAGEAETLVRASLEEKLRSLARLALLVG